ncbi:MAG: hypothetical protein EXS52_01965 [Candidatus Staskawiczbacteria bacterium]|nr:hypothetical protein [Candidatus Staskawiczbacteria bacterium]
MKAVLVGTIGDENKLYYVIDASSSKADGVLSDGKTSKVVDFWKTAIKLTGLKPIKSSNFHKFLWDNEYREEEDEDRWNRVFVNKTQKIPDGVLSGVTIINDVLKSKIKSKSIDQRVSEFKTLLETQNVSIVRNKYKKTLAVDGMEKK